jgi:leader peptidase (prepilin peptidase)/N-methyltransferase
MEAIGITIFTVLGVVIASFLNVCIDRIPAGQSVVTPPSHCPTCKKRLTGKDLVPIVSYLWLRGRCRYCSAPIPKRILIVEIATGALFAYLFSQHGANAELVVITSYCCLFIVLMVIDLEKELIPNRIVYPAMVAALLISIFLPDLTVVPGIRDAAIGGGIGFGLGLLVVVLSRGGMGFGDVKMAALMGFVIGYPMIFFTLILGSIIGGIIAIILLATKKKRRKEGIPFGPVLAASTIVTLLWVRVILNLYLGFF